MNISKLHEQYQEEIKAVLEKAEVVRYSELTKDERELYDLVK